MSMLKAALGLLGYAGSAYMNDAVVKPRRLSKLARAYCDRVGKPMLCIRAPRVADKLMGDPVPDADATTGRAYPLPVGDGTFGAIVAVNTLEGLRRPDLALAEWRRVADKVFVVVPSWFSPQAWLDPTNRWLVDPDLRRVIPLWTDRRKVYLLPVSDNRYGRPPWSLTRSSPSPTLRPAMTTRPTTPSPTEDGSSPSPRSPDTEAWSTQPTLDLNQLPSSTDPSPPTEDMTSDRYDASDPLWSESDLTDLTPLPHLASSEGSPPGASSNSPRALTVVSSPMFDDD